MGQKENKKQLLRLHRIITGSHQTLKQITSKWDIVPDITLIHNNKLSRRITSDDHVSIEDYYPLISDDS